jgi:subtilisin family serine protease
LNIMNSITGISKFLIVIMLLLPLLGKSQTVYEWYQDGIIVFQLKTSVQKLIPSKDKIVDYKSIPYLEREKDKFGIFEVTQLHPNDRDEKLRRTYQIKFTEIEKIDDFIEKLSSVNDLEYAEKKELHRHFLTPNDLGPNATNAAGTSPTNNQWSLWRIQAQQAWDLSTGSAAIRVAVTDDAIRTTHQDLQNKLLPGYDAPTGGSNPNPCGSNNGNHGTHVAGTVGAETNNGVGVASIGYNVSIIPVKIGNCNGALTHGYEGINWAANNGADVINMSWGGAGSSNYGLNVCNAAANAGVVLVAAAGNDGTNQQFFPAAYSSVIAVASTTPNDAKSSFSQYGTWINISAPGSNIRSSYATSNTAYSSISGTSMASPHVAGLVGLMKSYMPTASRSQLITCLYNSADNISAANPSFNGQLGAGRINAYQALLCMAQYNVALDAGIIDIQNPGTTVCAASFTPVVTLRNFGTNTLTSVTINYSWGGNNFIHNWTGSLATGLTTNVTLPLQVAATGSYTFTASTSNPNGGTDQNASNNASSKPFFIDQNGQTVNLTVRTDCYGDEVSWQVRDASNNVVASGGPYVAVSGGATNNHSFCLPVGCYTFSINDTYGDGMYGAQWQNCSVNGNYFMRNQLGDTLFRMTAPNANYGFAATHNFCVSDPNNLNDAGIAQISSPDGIACSTSITPSVELLNYGVNTLTSVTISYNSGGAPQIFNWNGSLTSGQSTIVSLPAINVANGSVSITASTSNPNGQVDNNTSNDQASTQIIVYGGNGLSLPFTENFENNPFTNNTWTVVNPDNDVTWVISNVVGTSPGNKAAKMDFFNYSQPGRRDGMITPKINLAGYSSVNMTFEHAYRRYIVQGSSQPAPTDSLIIYVSGDCGLSWTKVFEAGENGTGTFATIASSNQVFTPTQTSDWCMGTVGANCFSVNLNSFIGQQVLIKFEGFNAGTLGNNLYVDNINITGVAIPQAPIAEFFLK